jgi:hypothetical protein
MTQLVLRSKIWNPGVWALNVVMKAIDESGAWYRPSRVAGESRRTILTIGAEKR